MNLHQFTITSSIAVLCACGGQTIDEAPTMPEGALGEWVLDVNPSTGEAELTVFGTTARGVYSVLNFGEDGNVNTNPAGTIQAVTTNVRLPLEAGCPADTNCFTVQLTNFTGQDQLDVFMGIDRIIPPTGRAIVASDAVPAGVSASGGGRGFGALAGGAASSALQVDITIPDLTNYQVRGRFWGDRPGVLACGELPPLGPQALMQQATATYSQGGFSVASSIDGATGGGTGWAISPAIVDQTAAYETVVDTPPFPTGTELFFLFHQNFPSPSDHLIGRFRLAVTTAERSQFANGVVSGGDIGSPTIWTAVPPSGLCASNGADMTVLGDNSVLVEDVNSATGTYEVMLHTAITGITGIRLEVLEHASLPHAGPGLQNSNGNFVLSELELFVKEQ